MSKPNLTAIPLINSTTVAELREIMEQEFPDLVQTLFHDLPLQLAKITKAIELDDSKTVYITAHKLKSGSGSIGAMRLSELARQIEIQGRSGNLATILPLLDQVRMIAEQTQDAFQALLDQYY